MRWFKRLNWELVAVLVVAAGLRGVGLGHYPVGLTADEASWGYDAYSLLLTGKDQWGESFPVALRSFGDFKPALYAYLAVPFIGFLGLTEVAVRLPNAILGVVAVGMTYFAVKELWGEKGETLAVLAALLLAVSPWHVSLSRGAFEANLSTALLAGTVGCFLRGLKRPRWLWAAAVFGGVNLFSYHAARYAEPLILGLLVWWRRDELLKLKRKLVGPGVVLALFLGVLVVAVVSGGGARVGDVAVFNPTDRWEGVKARRYEAVTFGLPDSVARVFSNKAVYVAETVFNNWLTYTSATFLLISGAGETSYGMVPGTGVLYLVEGAGLVVALVAFLRRPKGNLGFLLGWIVLGFLPASFSKGEGRAAQRAAVVMPAIQIVAAYGWWVMLEEWGKKRRRWTLAGSLVILAVSLGFFLENYLFHGPRVMARGASYGWREAMAYVGQVEGNYDRIVVSRAFSEPQIFVMFYLRYDPQEAQGASDDWMRYEAAGVPFLDLLGEYKLGKYTFREITWAADKDLKRTLLVGSPKEFYLYPGAKPVKTVNDPGGEAAIVIVDPEKI